MFGNPFSNQEEDELFQESLSSANNFVKKMPTLLSIAAKSTIAQRLAPSFNLVYENSHANFS